MRVDNNVKGDIVTIYEDPITKNVPEGKAELIRYWFNNGSIRQWTVKFLDDGFVCERFI